MWPTVVSVTAETIPSYGSGMRTITSYADVTAVLSDARFDVPPLPPSSGPMVGIDWLRAHVARFSTGTVHTRRRALATAELDRMDLAALRRRAQQLAADRPSAAVPVVALAEALSAAPAAADVAVVAGGYHPGTGTGPHLDVAVSRLVDVFGGIPDEATAARIGLLVQAYSATAGLIDKARPHRRCGAPVDAVLLETLRHDPPVRTTRRVSVADGAEVLLDLATANRDPRVFAEPDEFDPARPDRDRHLTFGAGPRQCPGRAHALAIAAGVLDVED